MVVASRVSNLPNRFQILGSSLRPSFCRNPTKILHFFAPEPFRSSPGSAILNKRAVFALLSAKTWKTPCGHPVNCSKTAPENGKCGKDEFIVVNFYRFVHIEDPQEEIAKQHSFLESRDICGRIYLNEHGINAQYSGPSLDALAYAEWLKEDERFSDILVQITPASNRHAFPRLKLRYKPSLLQMEGGISHLPLLDSEMRAVPLEPSEWRKRLQIARISSSSNENSSSTQNRKLLLLDVRNGYEWDIGHFRGAQRPPVDCFRSTSFGLSDSEKKGFQNLYTLKGGVSHYLEHEDSGEDWEGNLFVFDSRMSLQPSTFNPDEIRDEQQKENGTIYKCTSAKCHLCGFSLLEFRHRNCANLDCNLLFLSCNNCVEEFRGCCSLECTSAPRLRPVLPGHQRYQKWHIYRDSKKTSIQPV